MLWWFVGGMAVGILVVAIIHRLRTTVGTLLIDDSSPEKDIYRINIDDLDKLSSKKRVILKVKRERFNSPK